jgi:hypothetical protein
VVHASHGRLNVERPYRTRVFLGSTHIHTLHPGARSQPCVTAR